DPGNLESNLQAGAVAGYSLLWVLFWSHAIGLVFQILAARLGIVTRRHLAEHVRARYSPCIATILWLTTEVALISADVQEVIGTAIALQVLFHMPVWLSITLTTLNIPMMMLIEWLGRRGSNSGGGKQIEWCFAAAIGLMAACFFWAMGLSQPKVSEMLVGWLVPSMPDGARIQAVGLLGAIIMPHNIYLHSALVQPAKQEPILPDNASANYYLAVESGVTLFVSFLINGAILVTFACAFHQAVSLPDLLALTADGQLPGLYEAASVLEHVLGYIGPILWGVGLLAASQTATMTVTVSGQRILDGFWHTRIKAWQRIAGTRMIAAVPTLIVSWYFANRLDDFSEWLNVVQSICLPAALIPLLRLTDSKAVM
ncbi:NRAMP family, partial [Thamnocephalis sphaerospora]